MISWQGRLLTLYYRIKKWLQRPGAFDLIRERADLEALGRQWGPKFEGKPDFVNADGVPGAWLVPPEVVDGRVLIFFHGGGYVIGSIQSHLGLMGHIAQAVRAQALSVDYRLAPEDPFPAAVDDAVKVYRWAISQGCDPAKVIFAGDSAGGGLVLAALIALRDAGDPLPAAAACLSPWTDLTCNSETWSSKAKNEYVLNLDTIRHFAKLYLGETDPTTPLASPLYADLSGLPPLLIQVGSDEILLDDAVNFAKRAEAAGVAVTLEVWERMQHVWQFVANILPEAQDAIGRIGSFIDEVLRSEQ